MSKTKFTTEDLQEIDFNEEYKKNSMDQLNTIKNNLDNIVKEINKFKFEINNYFKNINKFCEDFLKEITDCISWLEDIKNYNINKDDDIKNHINFINNIHNNFTKCNNLFKNMDNENYMNKIYNLNNGIKKTIKDIIDLKFYAPKCENKNNSIIKLTLKSYESEEEFFPNKTTEGSLYERVDNYADDRLNINNDNFNILNDDNNNNVESHNVQLNNREYQEYNIERNNNNSLKCSYCRINDAIYKCFLHCNDIFCEGCFHTISEFEQNTEHKLRKIDNLDKEKAKDLFLKNFMKFIKYYLIKCNYLLNLENPDFILPTIENINDNDFESQKIYLNKIIGVCHNLEHNEEDELDESNTNPRLVSSLNNLFKNKKIHISNDNIDNDDDFYSDENCTKLDIEFDNLKDNLIYLITVVSKDKFVLREEFADVIISRISDSLTKDKNNIFILLNDKIDNFVKSKKFADLSYNQIQLCENPIFNNFKDVKILIDQFLCGECKIPKIYFDYKGNCLNPNLSNNINRGTEIYDPPYGWKAIGLNVEGKYNNNDWLENKSNSSEWAIAYHGISQKISEENNKKVLKYIITKNGIKNSKSKMKSNSNDKRNWGKVGEGIYLSPKIKTAENYTGIISFNNKKYKVLFMAKVFIKGIREPEYTDFWVLEEKYIRIYRILFKEIS